MSGVVASGIVSQYNIEHGLKMGTAKAWSDEVNTAEKTPPWGKFCDVFSAAATQDENTPPARAGGPFGGAPDSRFPAAGVS
jgi:hypothetical protein